jgi:S-sulfo-L-cysteine synthase (3-phospho-L-serine-dependent)
MSVEWLVLVESNTTGSGRLFCAAARTLGLRPVLFARDPGRYPYVGSDGIDHRRVDTADPAAIGAACADLAGRVAGVTSSSEYSIAIAAQVARARRLPHPDPDAVRACRDKHTQRVRLRGAGVPGPRFAAAATAAGAVTAAARIGLPVVVKPVAGSGSIATRLCRDAGEVRAAAAAVLDADPAALGLPPQDAVMVEEYLDGVEYSVETLGLRVVGVTRKHLGPPPYFVETGHDFPAPVPRGDRVAFGEAALAALRALGLGWGAAHVELRHTAAGPRIVEVNPRLAGGLIPRVVEQATGIDLITQVIAGAAGRPVDLRPGRDRAASIRFLVAGTAGHLLGVDGLDEARRLPLVDEAGAVREPGYEVRLSHSFQDRLGYVITSAARADADAAARAADEAVRTLTARIAPAPSAVDGR